MKFVFLCSSLSEGKDGVGDYTRNLARELTGIGHRCLLIALNDSEPTAGVGVQEGGEILRLSRTTSWNARVERALAVMTSFCPDWISLQFVPYGFHPKGLCLGLAEHLAPLFRSGRHHIMFHELWIGESVEYGLKDRAIGFLQKRGVLRLLQRLEPAVIHTSNPVYRELLERNGVSASELPLAGNIPVVEPEWNGMEMLLRDQGWPMDSFRRDEWLVGGVFGTIHSQWLPAVFLDQLSVQAGEMQKRVLLVHLGRTANAGTDVWQRLAKEYVGRCEFIALGPQSETYLSTLFQSLDFGMATSPWALIGKSGSVAAMLDHGLPVMVTRDDWRLRNGVTPEPTPHPLLFKSSKTFFQQIGRGLPNRSAGSGWPAMAEQFLQDLPVIENQCSSTAMGTVS